MLPLRNADLSSSSIKWKPPLMLGLTHRRWADLFAILEETDLHRRGHI